MSGGLSKILKVVLYFLIGVSALLGILFYTETVDAPTLMIWCYILLGVSVAAAIIFPILGMATNPKGAKSALIGVVALAVVFGISYALGGDEMLPKYEEFISSPKESKLVSMGLISFYILAALAIVATVSSGFIKLFK